jgi:hypothetical protein
MTDNFKATPEQWADAGAFASATRACILELRARIEQLEAQASNLKGSLTSSTPPPVATVTRDRDETGNYVIVHNTAGSREVADPAPVEGGLVARVAYAITGDSDGPINWKNEARAAILEVAKWLREQGTPASGWAMRLEQEAGR